MGEQRHGVDAFLDCCELQETDGIAQSPMAIPRPTRHACMEEDGDRIDEGFFSDSDAWRDLSQDPDHDVLPVGDTHQREESPVSTTSPTSLRLGPSSDSGGSPATTCCSLEEQPPSRKRRLPLRGCDETPPPKKFRLVRKCTVPEAEQGQADPVNPASAERVVHPEVFDCQAEVAAFRALKKKSTAHQRSQWVSLWIKTRPQGFFHHTTAHKTKKDFAHGVWTNLTWEQAESEWVAMVRQGQTVGNRGAREGNRNAAKSEMEEIKATAVMVCWNMPPCKHAAFLELYSEVQAVDPEDVAYDELLAKVKNLPVVRESWTGFQQFLRRLKLDSLWGEESECMELSLHAEEPRWHFHLVVSNARRQRSDRLQSAVVVPKEGLQELAPNPDVKVCYARGRSAEAACQRLHCYCQWPKRGSVYTKTNYLRGVEFVCRASWTLAAWQLRKLSYRGARKEIIANRDAVEPALGKIQAVWDAEVMEYMRSRKAMAVSQASGKLKKFKSSFQSSVGGTVTTAPSSREVWQLGAPSWCSRARRSTGRRASRATSGVSMRHTSRSAKG